MPACFFCVELAADCAQQQSCNRASEGELRRMRRMDWTRDSSQCKLTRVQRCDAKSATTEVGMQQALGLSGLRLALLFTLLLVSLYVTERAVAEEAQVPAPIQLTF